MRKRKCNERMGKYEKKVVPLQQIKLKGLRITNYTTIYLYEENYFEHACLGKRMVVCFGD